MRHSRICPRVSGWRIVIGQKPLQLRSRLRPNDFCSCRGTTRITGRRALTLISKPTGHRRFAVSRASLLCLGYSLFSLFATWFPVVVSQYLIHAQLRSPPRRSGRAPLTHPAPSRYLSTALLPRDITIRSVSRRGDASGFCSRNALNFAQLK